MRISLLLAAAAVLALLALLLRGGGSGARDAVVTEPRAVPAPAAAPAEPALEEGPRTVDAAEVLPEARAVAPPRTHTVRGTAADLRGAPMAGVGLAAASDGATAEPRGHTAADGTFDFELPRSIAEIVSTDRAWLVLSGGQFRAESAQPLQLVLAPRGRLEGSVVSARTDEPVPGAQVRAVPPPGVAWSPGGDARTNTDSAGAFALDAVPALPGMRLSITAPGYLETALELGSEVHALGVLRLELCDAPRAEGRVLLPDGRPAAGAEVALGRTSTRTDADGRFELRAPRPEPGAELRARLAPHAPTVYPGVGARLLAGEHALDLELVLSAEGVALEGRVVDAAGIPVKGCAVEAYTTGASQEPAGRAGRTRKDGTFRIEGLAPGGVYALVSRGRSTSDLAFMGEVVAPAAGLELAVTSGERRLSGLVLLPNGAPAAERAVELLIPAVCTPLHASVRTDAAGRFAFDAAPAHAVLVRVTPLAGESAHALLELAAAGGDRDFHLRLAGAHALRFEAEDVSAAPDALFAVDAAGAPVALWDSARRSVPRADLYAGRSEALSAPESAAVLVLCRGGRELARIALAPDGSGLVRW